MLLIVDNHYSHRSLEAYDFCHRNGIVMLSFPPHTSHKLQPLDLTFSGPLKKAFNTECDIFLRNNAHEKITHFDIAEILNKAFLKAAAIEKVQERFEISNISPFNPNLFSEGDFTL